MADYQVTLTRTIRIPVSSDIAKNPIAAVAVAEQAYPGYKADAVEHDGDIQGVIARCEACSAPILEDDEYTCDGDLRFHSDCWKPKALKS